MGTGRRRSLLEKGTAINRLNPPDLIFAQLSKLVLARPLRKSPSILVKEAEEQVYGALWHVEERLNVLPECVIAAQESRFGRQVRLDGPLHALIEEFGVGGGIEVAIEITGVVEDAHVEPFGRLPLSVR